MTGGTIKELEEIVAALSEGGYDPYAQLYGFLKTGDETCITRRNGARDKIKQINRQELTQFVQTLAPNRQSK